jgi:Protein of unknown function (DUF2917).
MQNTAIFRAPSSESRPFRFRFLRNWLRTPDSRRRPHFSPTTLSKGDLQRMRAPRGTTLSCLQGTLWITDASGWEIVLETGEEWHFSRETDLLLEALAPARFTLRAANGIP